MRAELDKRAMLLLSSGHFATDFASGALPALIPYFKDRFGLSYTLAAALMFASAASSSVIQPLFGLWSDRRGALWLLPTGVAATGVGMALAADAPAYSLVVVLVVLSGLGSAAFHPEGSKFAAYASGRRRASGMSAFSIGGNLGYALGPVAAGALVASFGLSGGLLLVVPCAVVAAALLMRSAFLRSFAPEQHVVSAARGEAVEDRRALNLLLAIVALRSVTWFGLITFVPLWEVSLGHSKTYGAHLLALMLLAGGIGTIAAGPAADRFGTRSVLLASLFATPPLVAGFILFGGTAGAFCLALVAVSIVGTFGVTMVMSQQYLPGRIGLASGLSIGMSVGLGGIAAVLLGAVADSIDLRSAMWIAAAAPVLALLLGSFLPSRRRARELGFRPVSEP